MTLDTYGHVFEQFEGGEQMSAESTFAAYSTSWARLVSAGESEPAGSRQHTCEEKADARIRTGDPFITRSLPRLRVFAAGRRTACQRRNP